MQRGLLWRGARAIPDSAVRLPPLNPDVAHALEEVVPQDVLLSSGTEKRRRQQDTRQPTPRGWRWGEPLVLPLPSRGAGWCPGSPPPPRWRCWSCGPPAWPRGDAPGCSAWKSKARSLLSTNAAANQPPPSKPNADGGVLSSPALTQRLRAHAAGEALSESVLQHRRGGEQRETGRAPSVSPHRSFTWGQCHRQAGRPWPPVPYDS